MVDGLGLDGAGGAQVAVGTTFVTDLDGVQGLGDVTLPRIGVAGFLGEGDLVRVGAAPKTAR